MRGRVYMYYEDHVVSSNPAPIFIPETSILFDDEKFCHLPIVTDEQFDMIVKEESRIKKEGTYYPN